MAGFYGNIRNTTSNSFKFDRVYSNRFIMDKGANSDGVFGGRYVLVEYDQGFNDGLPAGSDSKIKTYYKFNNDDKCYLQLPKAVLSTVEADVEENTTITVNKYELKPVEGDAGIDYSHSDDEWLVQFLKVDFDLIETGYTKEFNYYVPNEIYYNEEIQNHVYYDKPYKFDLKNKDQVALDIFGTAELYTDSQEEPIKMDFNFEDNYTINYNIDKYFYSNIGRGYDSTVWRKVYKQDGSATYVNVAELNSVVPTFAISSDSPSAIDSELVPFMPYFDKDSTNVYYKLHLTAPWDFRIASFSDWKEYDDNIRNDPDSKYNREPIKYKNHVSEYPIIKDIPVPDDAEPFKRDIVTYQKTNDEWIANHSVESFNPAIYFNKAGLTDLDFGHNIDPKSISDIGDTILVRPIGKSGREYTSVDPDTGASKTQEEIDTQELAIILPTIGNIISEVYDKLYGPGILKENAKIVYDDNGVEQYWPDGSIKYEYDVIDKKPRQRGIHWEDPVDLHIDDKRHRMVSDENNGYYYTPLRDNPDGSIKAPQRVDSLAGAINSVHDLLGMIITKHLPAQRTAEDMGFAEIPDTEETYLPNGYPYYIYCEPVYELVYTRKTVDGNTHVYPENGNLELNYIPTSDFVRVEGKNYYKYKKNNNTYELYAGSISDSAVLPDGTRDPQYYELENLYHFENGYMTLATEAKGYTPGSHLDVFDPEVKYYRETKNNNFFYAAKTYGYRELDMSDETIKNNFIPTNGQYGYEQHRAIDKNEIDIKQYGQDKYRQIGDTPYWVFDDHEDAYAESLYYDLPATLTWAGRLSGGSDDIYTKNTTNGVTTYTKADKNNMIDGVQYYTLNKYYKVKKGNIKRYTSTGSENGTINKLKEFYVPEWENHYFVYNPTKGYTFWRASVANFDNMSLEQQRNRWNADANAGKIYHNFSEDTFEWGGTPVPSSDGGQRMEYNFYVYNPGVHYIQRTNKLNDKIEYVSLAGTKTYKNFTCMQEFKDYIDAVCVDNETYEFDRDNLWRRDGERLVPDPLDPSAMKVIIDYSRCPIYKFVFNDPEFPFFTSDADDNYKQITNWNDRYIGDGGSSMDKNDPDTWPYLNAYVRLTETLVTPYKKNTYYVIETHDDKANGVTSWDAITFGLNDGSITRISTKPSGSLPYCKVLEFKLATADNVQLDKIYWRCDAPTLAGVGISPKIAADGFEPYLSNNKDLYFVNNVLEWSPEEGRFEMANKQRDDFAEKYNSEEDIQYYIEEKLCVIDQGSFASQFSLYQLWNFNVIQDEEDYNYFFNPDAHTDDPEWSPIRLGYKVDTYVKRDLPGFARDINTMHGMLLKVNELLQIGDYKTRDENTVQGCINILHDMFEKFDALVPGELYGANKYGRVVSMGFEDTNNGESWISLGTMDDQNDDTKRNLYTFHRTIDEFSRDKYSENTARNTELAGYVTALSNDLNTAEKLHDPFGFTTPNRILIKSPVIDNAGHTVGEKTTEVMLSDLLLKSNDQSIVNNVITTLNSPKGNKEIKTTDDLKTAIQILGNHINEGASNITLNEYNNYYNEAPYYITPDTEKKPGKTYYIKQGNTFVEYTVNPWPEQNRPDIYEKYVVDQKGNIPDVDNNDNINEAIAKLQWQLNHIANRLLTDLDSNANQVPNGYNAFTNDTVTNGIAATDTLGIGLNKLQKQLEDLNSRLYHFSDRKLVGIGDVSTNSTAPLTASDTLGQGLIKLQNRIYNIENFKINGVSNETGLTNIFAGIVRSDKVPTNLSTGILNNEISVPALRSGWIWVDTANNYIYIKTKDGLNGENSTDAITRNYWELLNAWQ